MSLKVGNREIGDENPCFVVAEAGLAHGGDIDNAKALIDLAFEANADAIKFQIYKTKDLIDENRDPGRFKRFKECELSYDLFSELKAYADNKKIICFATPHTVEAAEFLLSSDNLLFKIGSGERDKDGIFDILIDSGKPLIISTGMRTHSEVYDLVKRYGSRRTAFLHCITMYPALDGRLNLAFLSVLESWCRGTMSVMGYSDHSVGFDAVKVAVCLGVKIIEKHIRLSGSTGQDTHGALDRKDFKKMVSEIRRIETMLGSNLRIYSAEEKENEAWALKGLDRKRPFV